MAKYEKWLGAGLGWAITGNPLGSLLGYMAGKMMGGSDQRTSIDPSNGVSEFEVNLIVLSSYLIKVDGKISLTEINFVKSFMTAHFEEANAVKRSEILNHCLQKEYDLNVVCDQIRSYTQIQTRRQVVNFLIDLANCDGVMTERENYFIFRIAGYLNINDVDYRKIKNQQFTTNLTAYDILGVSAEMNFSDIRTVYRRMILQYHPDRNKEVTEEEKKKLAIRFQQIKEAYEQIKREKEPN